MNSNIFILKKKIKQANNIITLRFLPVKNEIFSFRPGQFVIIYFFDERCGGQGKPYSISSCPKDKFLNITVKQIGKFSEALHKLKINEKIKISSPQGYFCAEDKMEDIIFFAGGIGIAPFYSIINDFFKKRANDKKFTLFYSNKTKEDVAFLRELEGLSNKGLNLRVIYAFTQEKGKRKISVKNLEFERLNVKIIKKYLGTLNKKQYFICGSINFVNSLWKILKKAGVKEDYIKLESFY